MKTIRQSAAEKNRAALIARLKTRRAKLVEQIYNYKSPGEEVVRITDRLRKMGSE